MTGLTVKLDHTKIHTYYDENHTNMNVNTNCQPATASASIEGIQEAGENQNKTLVGFLKGQFTPKWQGWHQMQGHTQNVQNDYENRIYMTKMTCVID